MSHFDLDIADTAKCDLSSSPIVSFDAQTDDACGDVNRFVGDVICGNSSKSNPSKEVRYDVAVETMVKREDTASINIFPYHILTTVLTVAYSHHSTKIRTVIPKCSAQCSMDMSHVALENVRVSC